MTENKSQWQTIVEFYYNRADKKENLLTPVNTQCQWLRDIGFQDVDCFLKVFELALFGGRKTAKSNLHHRGTKSQGKD